MIFNRIPLKDKYINWFHCIVTEKVMFCVFACVRLQYMNLAISHTCKNIEACQCYVTKLAIFFLHIFLKFDF